MSEQPLQGPQLKGPSLKAPSMDLATTAMTLVKAPLNLAKAVLNPLKAPKLIMEALPGGAGELGPVKEAAGLLAKIGGVLKNPLKELGGTAVSAAQGQDALSAATGGAAKATDAAMAVGKGIGKATQMAASGLDAGASAAEAAGAGLAAGGQGLMGVGKALQGIPIAGQILGIPVLVAGVGVKAMGVTAKVGAKAAKVAAKATRAIGKVIEVSAGTAQRISKAIGKTVKPVLKLAKQGAKPLKAVARRTAALARGAGSVATSAARLGELQDHAARGNATALAKTAHGSISGVRGGLRQASAGARVPGSSLFSRALAGTGGASAPASAGKPASGSLLRALRGVGRAQPSPSGRTRPSLRAGARRVMALPQSALARLQGAASAVGHLMKLQDHAAKGDLGSATRAATQAGKDASRAASAPPLPRLRSATPRQQSAIKYARENRVQR